MTSADSELVVPHSATTQSDPPAFVSSLYHAVERVQIFWVCLALIVGLGFIPRILTYDYGLPYIEYIDELMLYFIGQRERGIELTGNIRGTGYPPLFVQMQVATQQFMEAQGRFGPASSIHTLRVLALITNLCGIAGAGVLARRLAGDIAGCVAALGWAISTVLVRESVYAIGESFVYPLLIFNLLFATIALSHRKWGYWTVASILVGLITALFEYRLGITLLPGILVMLVHWLHRYHFEARQWILLVAIGVIGTAVIIWVGLEVGRMLLPSHWYNVLNTAITQHVWDIPVVFFYIAQTIEPAHLTFFFTISILAICASIIAHKRGVFRVKLPALLSVIAVTFMIPWIASAVRVYGNEETEILQRHILPATGLIFVLLGVGVAQIVYVLPARPLKSLAVAVLAICIVAPQVQPLSALIQSRQFQPWPVIVREWADTNLEAGTIIVYSVSERWFNPLWGGISHRKWFDWWPTKDILEYPLEEWVEQRGMSYAMLPIPQYHALQESAEGQALLARMLRLRDFVHPPARREAETIFYRLWRMEQETNIHFGNAIVLTGYDQSADTIRPGETVDFTFYWNAPTTPDDNYSLFVHLVPDDEYTVLAQADGAPAVPERPTLTWDEPSETLISPVFSLSVPSGLAPGDYRVMIGLYNFQTGARLPIMDANGTSLGDAFQIASLQITAS